MLLLEKHPPARDRPLRWLSFLPALKARGFQKGTTMTPQFNPGDKVVKRRGTQNVGTVMDIPAMEQKPGYVAVYFLRKVWVKPENIRHVGQAKQTPQHVKHYW